MYPMLFMERFWRGEPKNELFVAIPMPPDGSFESRFEDIKTAAQRCSLGAVRSKEILGSNAVFTQILRGLANSKLVLCDLSDDHRGSAGYANGNVLHEAGIAMTIREEHEVILIREQKPDSIRDFDVRFAKIHSPASGEITKDWLIEVLEVSLREIELVKTERIKIIAESLDSPSLELITEYRGVNFVLKPDAPTKYWIAVHRLIDLGILRLNTAQKKGSIEYSYWWTSLLNPLMTRLGIT